MKLRCDEKREVYEYMIAQNRERGKSRGGKGDSSTTQRLHEAQDEYDEVARLCVLSVKSLKEGKCRNLLAQAARHHAAQINFFRKGLAALEAVDPFMRISAEKHRIDYELSGLDNGETWEREAISSYESTDDGQLSFDYRQKKRGLHNVGVFTNSMELDRVDIPQAPKMEDIEIKYQGGHIFGRQPRVSSHSAPIIAEKFDQSERIRGTQPSGWKFYSYVLPPPIDTKGSVSRTSTSAPHTNPFQSSQQPNTQSTIKDNNGNNPSSKLPPPSTERLTLRERDARNAFDSKQTIFKQGPCNPLTSTDLPQHVSRGPYQPSSSPNVSRSASPLPLTSPRISELHELPRPPGNLSCNKPTVLIGHSAPLFFKNKELSPTHKTPALSSISASTLPPPPLTVPRSFLIPSSSQKAMALHVAKLLESPQISVKPEEVPSPPLTR